MNHTPLINEVFEKLMISTRQQMFVINPHEYFYTVFKKYKKNSNLLTFKLSVCLSMSFTIIFI